MYLHIPILYPPACYGRPYPCLCPRPRPRLFSPARSLAFSFVLVAIAIATIADCTASVACAAGLDQYLVARWTFDKTNPLQSDTGNLTLRQSGTGRDQTLEFANGAAILGAGTTLVCEQINSKEKPGLAKAITIWARLRLASTAAPDSFLLGLRNETAKGDWRNMILAAHSRASGVTGFFSTLAGNTQASSGSRSLALEPDRFVSLALVFDGSEKSLTCLVDGQPLAAKHKDALALADFNNFAIGRLKETGGTAMTIDEVRIYSIALSPEWVADLTPGKLSLPASETPQRIQRTPRTPQTQRRIIADFEDAGTWRVVANHGTTPGAWFSGGTWMGGSQNAKFADEWVGEMRFNFAADATTGQRRMAFRRAKMSRTSGFLDGIEFDADSRGHSASLRFVLLDSIKKRHTTPPVRLGPAGWRRHRLALDASTWPAFDTVRFPASIEQIILDADTGGAGSLYMDDLALTGTFTRKDALEITPVYSGIHYEPGKPPLLQYRARNASPAPVKLETTLTVTSFTGAPVFSGRATATADAHGQARLRFALPALPVGAYTALLETDNAAATTGNLRITHEDSFGVFVPNGARVNRRPMWFGVQDQTMWQGEGENRLHLEWMKQIGFDLNRPGITGGRFTPGVPESLAALRRLFAPFEAAGIDSSLLFGELPPALTGPERDTRAALPPENTAAFEHYAAGLGSLLSGYPGVKYVEFWNEPDIGFYHGTLDDYWRMFAAFSRGLRSTAPRIKLATGGATVIHPREKPGFNQALYSQHGELYDIAAFHAHGPLAAYTERHQLVEKWLAGAGLSKPIANTESGERSATSVRGHGYAEQAITLVKKITWAKSRPRSEFHIWFTLQDYWDMDPDADDSFGLVTSDNRAKPALVACNELIRQLANTTPVAPPPASPSPHPGVAAYEFSRDDGARVLVCWASDGKEDGALWLRVAPDAAGNASNGTAALRKIDLFGLAEPLDTTAGLLAIPVGKAPLYLVSRQPFDFASPSDRLLDAPSEVFHDTTRPLTLTATLQNPDAKSVRRQLTLLDPAGAPLWRSADIPLAARETRRIEIRLPASPAASAAATIIANQTGARHTLALSDSVSGQRLLSLQTVFYPAYLITRTSAPPVINLRTAQDVTELTYDPAILAWRGPADLSVAASLSRDADAILFRLDVTDDRHVPAPAIRPDAELWRGDSVQVAFHNPANAAHTLFDVALRADGSPVVWCHKNPDTSRQGAWPPGLVARNIRRDGVRTLYEIRIPLHLLGLPPLATSGADAADEGLPVRFAFLVNEDDGQGRVRWMQWRGGLGQNQDISRLGHAIIK
ncbi:MAG: hypothetical protein LBK99_19425 [Opitutaceae bacterium]|jgi:hypothetical protein|nr:hypothetical protein [Opitutaceae bacterium]